MSESPSTELHVVDVCGTLVRDDTTVGLLRFHLSRMANRWIRKLLFKALTLRYSPIRIAFALFEKVTGRQQFKRLLVRTLAGDRVNDLEESARLYARELLDTRRVMRVWTKLETVDPRDRILLASASLEPVVRALADAIGARFVASRLEQRHGVLTGHFAEDLTGKKREAIARKFGENFLAHRYVAYSDNISDKELLLAASSACVVLRRAGHRQRWQGVAAEFVGQDE